MKSLKKSTITQGRLQQSIGKAVNRVAGTQITQQINDAVVNERVKTGIITKFYQFQDRAEVQIDETDELVLCRILHRFGGELTEYYTPTGDDDYCTDRNDVCVIPREELHVCLLNINDGTDDWLLLGYFNMDELIGINPAAQGNMKLVTRGGANQFWIKFGYDGLDLRLPQTAVTNVGDMDKDMSPVDYVDSTNVYTKDEVYTKEEVDELIRQAVNEALGEDTDDTTP